MKFQSDIDIDFGDREPALKLIKHVPATIVKDSGPIKHNTGVHVTEIPIDPFLGSASIDYKVAENRGYIKLDLLNVSIYSQISSEQQLAELMNREPEWHRLYSQPYCEQLIHIGNHYSTIIKMPEPIDSVERMAMFLAVIRPAKRHLIGSKWDEVAKTVWEADVNGVYGYKKSHAIAYAHLVVVNMNLLTNLSNQGN